MTTIDQNWLNLNRREPQEFFPAFLDYQRSANGSRTMLDTIHKGVKLSAEIFAPTVDSKRLDNLLGTAVNVMAIPALPGATIEAFSSMSAFGWKTIRDVTDAVVNYCCLASIFSENPLIGKISQVAEISNDSADLQISYDEYCKAGELEKAANGEVKNVFTQAKDYYWLRIAKAVASIASMILGLFLLAGSQWISGIAVLAISLTASILTILRDTQENSGKYPMLKFDHPVHIIA